MRDNERQRVFVFRTNVNEMDVEAIDLGDEIRVVVESRFDLAPVVFSFPVVLEFLDRRERHALRKITDSLFFRQTRRGDPAAQVGDLFFSDVHAKRANRIHLAGSCLCSGGLGHGSLLK